MIAGYICDQNYSYKNYKSIMINKCLNGCHKVDDEESKIASIQYYVAQKAMTEDEVKALSDDVWKTYDESAKPVISKADTESYVAYDKIVNGHGLKTYLSTDGFTFDTTDPEINIIEGKGKGNVICESATIEFVDNGSGINADTRKIGYLMNDSYFYTEAEIS